MQVVNVRAKNIQPKYKNLKEWCDDTNNVYIGRCGIVFVDGKRFPSESSIWCNPYKIDKDGTRTEVLDKYKKYIIKKIESDDMKKKLLQLKGKTLGCWCHPEKCHGDILVDLINNI